jgi:predicted Rdx family selenoprotein
MLHRKAGSSGWQSRKCTMTQWLLRSGLMAAAAVLSLAACESPGGKVSVLTGGSVAVQPGATYAWAPSGQAGSGDPRVDNDIVRERIQTAVDTNLAAKGYRQADAGSAQLLVQYHIGLQNKTDTQVNTMGGGMGPGMACGRRGCIGGYGWGMYGAPMDIDVSHIDYTEGTLMLDLVDRASGKLAWRATSQKRLDQKDADQAGVNAIVGDMVKSLP